MRHRATKRFWQCYSTLPSEIQPAADRQFLLLRLIGGVIARSHAIRSWLEILVLWVDEDHRGSGLGRMLMEQAEEEARRRGCVYARLASSDYQAPEFYKELGYSLYGLLENCPPGDTAYYFSKTLTERPVTD